MPFQNRLAEKGGEEITTAETAAESLDRPVCTTGSPSQAAISRPVRVAKTQGNGQTATTRFAEEV